MSNRPEDDIAALKTLFGFLLKQVKETTARAEALRVLLVNHGVFDQREFEQVYPAALAEWDRAMGAALEDASKVAIDATLTRLLQAHEGKPQ